MENKSCQQNNYDVRKDMEDKKKSCSVLKKQEIIMENQKKILVVEVIIFVLQKGTFVILDKLVLCWSTYL